MEISSIARHDLVTTADLRGLGHGPASVRALKRHHVIRHVIRGWYAVRRADGSAPWEGVDQFATKQHQHRLLATALMLSMPGRVAASHHSTLVLNDVDLWRSDLGTAHLVRTDDDHSRHRRDAVLHPQARVRPVATAEGLPTVPTAFAIVQTGLLDADQPFRIGPMEALVAGDSALFKRLCTKDDIDAALLAHSGHPGIAAVRRILEHVDGRHESVGETRMCHGLRGLGYRFTPQGVVEGLDFRVDALLDDYPVALEFDGLGKFGTTDVEVRRALRALLAREERLRHRGIEFVRVSWAELDNMRGVGVRVDAAIARTRRRTHPVG